jgi:hypothetical protein
MENKIQIKTYISQNIQYLIIYPNETKDKIMMELKRDSQRDKLI